jgi:hypothetical protein
MWSIGGMIVTGKPKDLEEKPISVPLCPPQNPTWTVLGVNLGFCGEKPAANCLCYGTACAVWLQWQPPIWCFSVLMHVVLSFVFITMPKMLNIKESTFSYFTLAFQ